jgi:hypothetical protein
VIGVDEKPHAKELLHQSGMDFVPGGANYLSCLGNALPGFGFYFDASAPTNRRRLSRYCPWIVVFTCVLGAAITMVAMEYFLFGFDTPASFKKLFWFCVMLFPPLGPPLYCFIVYSRSNVLQKSGDQRERGLR